MYWDYYKHLLLKKLQKKCSKIQSYEIKIGGKKTRTFLF